MNEDLIKKLRSIAEVIGGDFGDTLSQAAVALEVKAAPVGERETAIALMNDAVLNGGWNNVREMGIHMFQAGAAYQRSQQPQSAEAVETIDLDAVAWQSIKDAAHKSSWIPEQYFLNDWVADVCAFLEGTPQPSAGVVMQKLVEDADTFGPSLNAAGWEFIDTCPEKSALLFNTCKTALRVAILKYLELEFARLNGKEVGRG